MRFALVVSEWNDEITYALRDGAIDTLVKYGAKEKNISVHYAPGSFELTAGAKWGCRHKKIRCRYLPRLCDTGRNPSL